MNKKTITIFLSAISIILAIGAFAVYQGFVFSFDLTGSSATILIWIVYILTFGFIGMSVVGSYRYNILTRISSVLTGIWMGFFAYFLVASVLISLLSLFWPMIFVQVIGELLFLAAACVALYGVVHARNLKIKKVTVQLPNLPQSWKGKTAVWASDLHIGQIYGRELSSRVVKEITKLSPDVVFVGGDLFDGTAFDVHAIEPFVTLRPPHGVIFITGNHEEFGNNEKFLKAIRAVGMRVLIDEKIEVEGLQIIGVDYHNNVKTEDFVETLKKLNIDNGKPSILLKHEPKDVDVTEVAGVSLMISGHTHRAQIWPFRSIPAKIYKGYDYGLKNFKKLQVLVSSGAGSWGPPLRVGTDAEIVAITFE